MRDIRYSTQFVLTLCTQSIIKVLYHLNQVDRYLTKHDHDTQFFYPRQFKKLKYIKLVLCLQGNPQNIEWFNDDNLQKQVYDVGNVRFTFNEENFYKLAMIL